MPRHNQIVYIQFNMISYDVGKKTMLVVVVLQVTLTKDGSVYMSLLDKFKLILRFSCMSVLLSAW